MRIMGLQKMTLLDFPGRVACTIFTGGCNFRCPFCHNASLVLGGDVPGSMEPEELLGFLKKRRGLLDGVAVTGGEPTLHPDLPALIRSIRELGFAVKLDTNGTNPAMLRGLIEDGLVDYVAMDIKSSPERYAAVAGLHSLDLDPVIESRDLLLSGRVEYEFRTTVVRELHREEDFDALGAFIRGAAAWYLQCFNGDGDILNGEFSAWDKETLLRMLERVRPYVRRAELRGVD